MKLLWCGDFAAKGTGYETVAKGILPYLIHQGWELAVLGVNYDGDPIPNCPFPIYPAARVIGDLPDPCGLSRIADIVAREQPDVIFLCSDLWVCAAWEARIKAVLGETGIPIVAYFPVEGPGYSAEMTQAVGRFDLAVTYSHFGAKVLKDAGVRCPVEVIYPGVDTTLFQPMDKAACRAEFGFPEDAFIVLNANSNSKRKRLDITLKGFAKWLAEDHDSKENALLVLHTEPGGHVGPKRDGYGGAFDLIPLWERLCYEHKIPDPHSHIYIAPHLGLPDEDMPKLFCCADVMVNTSAAEGFGLIALEGAACGVLQIVPSHGVGHELFAGADITKNKALGLDTVAFISDPDTGIEHGVCAVKTIDDYLRRVQGSLMPVLAKNAYEFATSDLFNWDRIGERWQGLLLDQVERSIQKRQRLAAIRQMPVGQPVRAPKESTEAVIHKAKVSLPSTLLVCPSKGEKCGIAEYTTVVARELSLHGITAMVVETVEDACAVARECPTVTHILIQHEYSFFDMSPTHPELGRLTRGETTQGILRAIQSLQEGLPIERPLRTGILLHTVTSEDWQINKAFAEHPTLATHTTTFGGAKELGYAARLPLGSYSVSGFKPSPSTPPQEGEPWRIGNFGMAGNHRALRSHINVCQATDSILIGSFWCHDNPQVEAMLENALRRSGVAFSVETDFPEERELLRRLSPAHVFYMPRAEASPGHHYSSASIILATLFERPIFAPRVRCYADLWDVIVPADNEEMAVEALTRLRDPVEYQKACQRVRDWRAQTNVAEAWVAAGVCG